MSYAKLEELRRFRGPNPQTSYSAIGLHRKCPQAWYYRYGLGIRRQRDTPTPYLTLGSWWSVLRAMEAATRGREAGSLVFEVKDQEVDGITIPADSRVEDVLKFSQQGWKSMSAAARDEFIEKLGEPLPDRLGNMFQLWHSAHPERFEREQPLGVEVFWERDLPKPKGDAAWSLLADPDAVPTMKIIGFIDELYWDAQRGMVVIRDHKAPSDLSNVTTALDDLMDSQLQMYAWGIQPQLKERDLPAARAIAYDRTRSVAPKPPQVTATGGLSKSVTSYDAETYRLWAMTDGRPGPEEVAAKEAEKGFVEGGLQKVLDRMEPGPFWGKLGEFFVSGAKKGLPKFGTYTLDPKVLDGLQTPAELARWTKRTLSPVSKNMIETHMRSAVDTALDIYQTQQRAVARKEAARNLDRRGCQMCDFASLCRAQILGGPEGEYDLESFGLEQKAEKTPTKERSDSGTYTAGG